MHLFGIQDEAVREQINYVLDEDEIIGKGPNGKEFTEDGIVKYYTEKLGGQNCRQRA